MPDLDLTEAIEAAERAWTTFYPPAPEYDALTVAVRAAAPIIERAVREALVRELRTEATRLAGEAARVPNPKRLKNYYTGFEHAAEFLESRP